MTDTTNQDLANIWITSKSRMEAEKRFRRYDIVSHLLQIWYSIWLLGLSVFSDSVEAGLQNLGASEASILLSASILIVSVSIWGFKFGEVASSFRDCYLELDALQARARDAQEGQMEFREILKRYPNHATIDTERLLYERIVVNNEEIYNRSGKVEFGQLRVAKLYFSEACHYLSLVFFFAVPFVIACLLYLYG